jgi:hypothetical protein
VEVNSQICGTDLVVFNAIWEAIGEAFKTAQRRDRRRRSRSARRSRQRGAPNCVAGSMSRRPAIAAAA